MRSIRYGVYKRFLVYPVFSLIILAGCSHTSQIYNSKSVEIPQEAEYTAIYYIHGDSDYLFHLSDGTPVQANERALAKARSVAENAASGEVFIFHQKARRNLLGVFPRNRNEFYYYKNGALQAQNKYRYSDRDEQFLTTESDFFKIYRSELKSAEHKTYFFYFGHEIPGEAGGRYHRSMPGITVTAETFGSGLQNFITSDQNMELVVISTCSNATTTMVKELLPYTNYLLASPQNLHLSYIDTEALSLLETNRSVSTKYLATSMANHTYERLKEEVHTAVTLSVIELSVVENYIDEFDALISSYRLSENPDPYRDNIDCQALPFFNAEFYTEGVTTFFRPARFGRPASSNTHSGWGCKE